MGEIESTQKFLDELAEEYGEGEEKFQKDLMTGEDHFFSRYYNIVQKPPNKR